MEIQTNKDNTNIEIQTILHNFRSTEAQTDLEKQSPTFTLDIFTRTNKQFYAERFKISQAYEPMAIEVHRQLIGTVENDKEAIRVQSLCSVTNTNNVQY